MPLQLAQCGTHWNFQCFIYFHAEAPRIANPLPACLTARVAFADYID